MSPTAFHCRNLPVLLVQLIYPSDRELSESERNNICYLSFPDSNSGVMGNVQFSFRIRTSPATASRPLPPALRAYNTNCPPPDQVCKRAWCCEHYNANCSPPNPTPPDQVCTRAWCCEHCNANCSTPPHLTRYVHGPGAASIAMRTAPPHPT